MESKKSNGRIERATTFLTKLWWFFAFLIGIPITISTISFYVLNFIIRDIYISIGLSVIVYLFSIFFFYKSFDQYRNKPFFFNNINNLNARIHTFFIISSIALIVTPIFVFIAPEGYYFEFLPLISYCILYNIIYYYFFYKPIEDFDISKWRFKSGVSFKSSLKELHNLVVILNYIIHIFFLTYTYYTKLSWLFALVSNLVFYIYTILSTRYLRKKFKITTKNVESIPNYLIKFKKKFTLSIVSLCFVLLLQLPFDFYLVNVLSGAIYTYFDYIMISFVSMIFLFLYFKLRLYISIYYKKESSKLINNGLNDARKDSSEYLIKYQKWNMIISLLFSIFILLFSLGINLPIIIIIIFPGIMIATYYEQKANFCPKKYSRYIFLFTSIVILSSLIFLIIFSLELQIIIFLISIYLDLQIFAYYEYFDKNKLIFSQHLIAFTCFLVITYLFYPFISIVYLEFPIDLLLLNFINLLIYALLVSLALLGTFYYLYFRYFRKNKWARFSLILNIVIILVEILSYTLINLYTLFSTEFNIFIISILISTVFLPLIFDVFIGFNYILGISSKKKALKQLYYSSWILVLTIFSFVFYIFLNNYIFLIADLLYLSIFSQILIKFGEKIEQVSTKTYKKFVNFNSIFILVELYCLIFSIMLETLTFINIFGNVLLSSYISLISIAILINIFLRRMISKVAIKVINLVSLLFSTGLIFYYLYTYTLESYFILIIPSLFSCLFFYIFIFYLKLLRYEILPKVLFLINSIIVSISLSLIPSFLALERIKLGLTIDFFTVFNLTLYIIMGILFIISTFSQRLKIREGRKRFTLFMQILGLFVIAGTTVFYYSNLILGTTFFGITIPLIATSTFLFIPFILLYKFQFFKVKTSKILIFLNYLFLWGTIISIPIVFCIEFIRLGNYIEIYMMVTLIIIFLYGFLKSLTPISEVFKIKEYINYTIRVMQIGIWFSIATMVSLIIPLFFLFQQYYWLNLLIISCALILFFMLNIVNLFQLESFKQKVFENKRSKLDFYKIYKIFEYHKNIIYFGLVLSISLLFYSFFQAFNLIYIIFQSTDILLTSCFNLAIFLIITILLLHFTSKILSIEFVKTRDIAELLIWLCIKFNILLLFYLFPFQISVSNRTFLILLAFAIQSPITIYYINKHMMLLESTVSFMKKVVGLFFFISILGLFAEYIWNVNISISYFTENILIFIGFLFCLIYLFSNHYIIHFSEFIQKRNVFRIYRLYIISFMLLGLFLLMNMQFNLISLFAILVILFRKRNRNAIWHLLNYVVISFLSLIEINLFIIKYSFLSITYIHPGFYTWIYFISFISILFISIIFNFKKINVLEELLLDFLIPSLIFMTIFIFFPVPIFYNITISITILLFLISFFFYRKKDEIYIWFIRPCAILFLFNLISIGSYFAIFSIPLYREFNLILSSTLTFSVIGFCFALFYHNLEKKFKSKIISLILILSVISSFIFSYLFIEITFILNFIFPWLIAGNIAIILSYLSIGIYQWRISWAIWKSGYWLWIFVPILNYLLIAQSFAGIDIYTNALNFFGLNIYGSYLITLVICLLLSLPFWYTWIKDHFNIVLFILWGFSLFLIFWFSQNAFFGFDILIYLSFLGISIIFLMPIFYRLGFWKILSVLWLIFTSLLTIFITFILYGVGFFLNLIISLDLVLVGFLFIIFSFFPNLKAMKNIILIIAYSIVIIGLFSIILILMISITYNVPISINISFIIVAFSLFTSRILKLNRKLFNFLISMILTVNFSLLTFFSFLMIPNFEFFALFLAISVCGGSLLVFNRYRMFSPIKMIIPLSILSIGISLTISTLIYIFLPYSFFLISTAFVSIILLINYPFLKYFRHILWYSIPVPFCLFIMHFLSLLELFQSIFNLILIGLILYTSIFQIITNSIYGNIKSINLLAFVLNSTYISVFIAILSPLFIFYKILEFLIIWSILILLCIKYIEKKGQELFKSKTIVIIVKVSSCIALLLYFEISLLTTIIVNDFIITEFTSTILTFFGILFLGSLLDIILIKKVSSRLIFLINVSCYILISIYLFIFLNRFLAIDVQFIFLNLIVLLVMQFYTIKIIFSLLKQLDRYDNEKLISSRKIVQTILLNIIFFIISLFGSSYFTSILLNVSSLLSGSPAILFFLMIFSFLMFNLNQIINVKFKDKVLIVYYVIFMVSFLSFFTSYMIRFNLINLLHLSLIALIITTLLSYFIYLLKKIYIEKLGTEIVEKIYSLLQFFLYLEISLIIYSQLSVYLNIFEGILISQLILCLITLIEIYFIKKLKIKYGFMLHTISYFNISWALFFVVFQFTHNYFGLNIVLFTFMQFYTNHSYFITRSKFNPNKRPDFENWKLIRKKLVGSFFYFTLLSYIVQYLILLIPDIQLVILISSILIHGLMYLDKYVFKFLANLSKYLILLSIVLIASVSILYSLGWILTISIQIIPLTILIVLLEITYFIRLLHLWNILKSEFSKNRNSIILLFYLNFVIWPLFYLSLETIIILNILLICIIILIIISLLDIRIKAIKQNLRIRIFKFAYAIFGIILSIDIFTLLEYIIQPNFPLNFSVAGLIFIIVIGFLVRPFKKHRAISFFYWLLVYLFISLIIFYAYLNIWSFTILIFGVLLYPFIFMLEELRELFNHFLDYLRKLISKIKYIIITGYKKLITFLRTHFKVIRIFICLIIGIMTGFIFSEFVLAILDLYHSILLALATFGITYAFTDYLWYHFYIKNLEDLKQIFRHKLKIFIIIWISFSSFIFALILPYVNSVLYQLFLILIPLWGLGSILIWVVNRKEAKEKISVKTRFSITLSTIVLFIIWIAIILIWFFFEVRV
ncbi:MAG: hypothetical protein ACFE8V_02415 [Promethearchaeota archaeon]